MIKVCKKVFIIALILTPFMANTVGADEAELVKRIERLERIVKGQGLVSLLGRVDQLQNEVQRLNGENESLNHELDNMKKRQRKLYLDLDQRLQAQAAVRSTTPVVVANTEMVEKSSNESVDNTETVASVTSISPETAPVAVENGEAAYQSALQILRSGQYEQAVTALTAFPETYPHSRYLPNA